MNLSWSRLAQAAAVIAAVSSGAFVTGTYAQRLWTAERDIADTSAHLSDLNKTVGQLAGEMHALREFVETAVRYSRLTPPKDTSYDRGSVE